MPYFRCKLQCWWFCEKQTNAMHYLLNQLVEKNQENGQDLKKSKKTRNIVKLEIWFFPLQKIQIV